MRSLGSTVALVTLCGCATPLPSGSGDDIALACSWLTGTFSSASQSADDPDNFLPVRLVMVEIWPERTDGPWLYVEQAVEQALSRPYRQRVYRLSSEPGGVCSDVFELPGDAQSYVGAWRSEHPLGDITPEDLELREGCSIHLTRDGEAFVGATRENGCSSSLRGASYATSEVRLSANEIQSWDRGFDDDGQQVWGATEGPYVFARLEAEAPQ